MTTPPGDEQHLAIRARVLHPGRAEGKVLALDEPVSFWGGVSAGGTVIDAHHPQRGTSLTATILTMETGRGSSSSSSVLAEQIRSGAAPAGIVLTRPDTIIVLGAAVAAELYGIYLPVVQIAAEDAERLRAHPRAEIRATGDHGVVITLQEGECE